MQAMQILTWSLTLRHGAEAGASEATVHMAARPSMWRGGEKTDGRRSIVAV